MHDLEYVSSTRWVVPLDDVSAGTDGALDIRGWAWESELGAHDLLWADRPARTVGLEVVVADLARADDLRRASSLDVADGKPGRLVAQGEWEQRAYVLESGVKEHWGDHVTLSLKVALLDGVWTRSHGREFPIRRSGEGSWLDYPHGYPHDFARGVESRQLRVDGLTPCPVKLVIYGPATNPYVTIGGNRYEVSASIPDGAYLTIDGRSKTIVMRNADGSDADMFAAGVRRGGQGGGSYVFERLPPGVSEVAWDNTFGFTVTLYEEEGEPPWSRA
ncbi:hypothetical protein HLV35_03125 [Eggerthellaceae bacterium zg-997]|nr:hypothetical protein [Eggerthellaceae bacterium zg-997]